MHLLLLLASGVLAIIGTACLIKAQEYEHSASIAKVIRRSRPGDLKFWHADPRALRAAAAFHLILGLMGFILAGICITQLAGA